MVVIDLFYLLIQRILGWGSYFKHITTGDILVEAFKKGLITEQEANEIWASMLKKRNIKIIEVCG